MRRYNLRNFRKAIRKPELIYREASLAVNNIRGRINRNVFHHQYGRGSDFIEEDWDNLIILDACRYDVFEETADIPGELQYRISKGSNSWEFIEQNFVGKQLHDTVYVTGNSYVSEIGDDVFHAIEPVDVEPVSSREGFEKHPEDGYAVFPEDVVTETLEAREEFPDKRIISHFMQPHVPYLGETGADIYQRILSNRENINVEINGGWGTMTMSPAQIKNNGAVKISDELIWEAYLENFEIVMEKVKDLIQELSGKTVITADHGELLGEEDSLPFYGDRYGDDLYGHPSAPAINLRKVPWLVIDSSERRETTSEEPIESTRRSEAETRKQLEALGYK